MNHDYDKYTIEKEEVLYWYFLGGCILPKEPNKVKRLVAGFIFSYFFLGKEELMLAG